MIYRNSAGNEISKEKYDSMQPTTQAGQEVKDGYKPVAGTEEAPAKEVEVKKPRKKRKEQSEEEQQKTSKKNG